MVTKTKFDSIATLYRLCRASMVSQLKLQGLSDLKIAHSLTLTKNTLLAFIKCTEDPSTTPFVLDAPQYMFANREVTPTTYIDIQGMGLDTYPLSNGTALLVDPVTREFCYVFWDEVGQSSNPYQTHWEALYASRCYMQGLAGDALSMAEEMNENMQLYGTIDKPKNK